MQKINVNSKYQLLTQYLFQNLFLFYPLFKIKKQKFSHLYTTKKILYTTKSLLKLLNFFVIHLISNYPHNSCNKKL